MRRLVPLLAALALAGCGDEPVEQKPTPKPLVTAASVAPPASTAPAISLAGEWRVAGIDGAEFNEPYGLALSGSATQLWWEPRCAGAVRHYSVEASRVRFLPATPPPSGKAPATPPPVCLIAPPPRLADVMRALDSATAIASTPANGIEISGGGHSVVLYSQ